MCASCSPVRPAITGSNRLDSCLRDPIPAHSPDPRDPGARADGVRLAAYPSGLDCGRSFRRLDATEAWSPPRRPTRPHATDTAAPAQRATQNSGMARLLEASDVVLGDGMAVGRGRHNAGIRVVALRVGESRGAESGVVDPQVLATLVWLPRGAVVWVRGEGGRCWEGPRIRGRWLQLRWIYASDPHFVRPTRGSAVVGSPPDLGDTGAGAEWFNRFNRPPDEVITAGPLTHRRLLR